MSSRTSNPAAPTITGVTRFMVFLSYSKRPGPSFGGMVQDSKVYSCPWINKRDMSAAPSVRMYFSIVCVSLHSEPMAHDFRVFRDWVGCWSPVRPVRHRWRYPDHSLPHLLCQVPRQARHRHLPGGHAAAGGPA